MQGREAKPEDKYLSPRSHTITQMVAFSTLDDSLMAAETAPPEDTPACQSRAEVGFSTHLNARSRRSVKENLRIGVKRLT